MSARLPRIASLLLLYLGMVAASGCLVDPENLADASVDPGDAYRHGTGRPVMAPPGRWWKSFDDPGLDRLMRRLEEDNPTLAAALARYDRARAELGLSEADRFPAVSGELIWKQERTTSSDTFVPADVEFPRYRAALNLSYEVDLWGRVRQTVNAARAEAQAALADRDAERLSLQAELARTYFQLRHLDAEIDGVERSVDLRRENRDLVDARVEGGETTDLDLARAETELESTRAQLEQLRRSRASLFNALAALSGATPANFDPPDGGITAPPELPAGLPSLLLTRRPDVAAAERRMHAAAARIGAVRASYLPRVDLAGIAGQSSLDLDILFDSGSFFREIGPEVTVPLYQGGQLGSDLDRAYAESDEAVAQYREVVLGAFREVEDALADLRFLESEIRAHRRASEAAERAARLSRRRYRAGLVSYLEVVDADRTALEERRELIQALSARFAATVALVQALGGGWEADGVQTELSRIYAETEP